jgi:diguanylate cyclase (GGDEF)-like protein
MQFDTTTTLIAICAIIAVLGLQILVFWSRDQRSTWLGWFGFTFLFGAASLLIYLLPTRGMEFLVYGVGNMLRLAAFAFLWQDARVFSGRRPDTLLTVLCLTTWLALCSVPAFLDHMSARVVGTSVFIAFFCCLGAWELWRDRSEALPSRIPTIAVFLSFAAISAARIPVVGVAPFPVGALPVNGAWLAGFGLVAFTHMLFLGGFMLSMTRERRELEQRRFALSDPLTGLLNRRAFHEEAERLKRRKGARELLSVLVLDLDDFKLVNDGFGHDAGDRVLRHFADVARAETRSGDLLYRMGGEEFCFVLPLTGLAEARAIAERVRRQFADHPIEVADRAIRATVSIGVATTDQAGVDLELLLAAGDAAVYEAKASGRDRTIVANSLSLMRPTPAMRTAVA